MREIKVFNATVRGAQYDHGEGYVALMFGVEHGEILHLLLQPHELQTLAVHIERVSSQLREQKPQD